MRTELLRFNGAVERDPAIDAAYSDIKARVENG
jgi:hypothetical protein